MDVKVELSGLDDFLSELEKEILDTMREVGEEAVEYAKENGTYHDVTGNLRRSNDYKVSESGLTIYNTASYAESVEQRGYDVISGAALFAEKRLKEEFEA